MIRRAAARHPLGAEALRLGLLVVFAITVVLGLLPALLESAGGT